MTFLSALLKYLNIIKPRKIYLKQNCQDIDSCSQRMYIKYFSLYCFITCLKLKWKKKNSLTVGKENASENKLHFTQFGLKLIKKIKITFFEFIVHDYSHFFSQNLMSFPPNCFFFCACWLSFSEV